MIWPIFSRTGSPTRNALRYSNHHTEHVAGFVQLLLERYLELATSQGLHDSAVLQRNLPSLRLAAAAWRKRALHQLYANRAVHIAVIGPTQAGKSTVVNRLLRQSLAQVSPLAGYTVHPCGFAVNVEPAALEWLAEYFAPLHRVETGVLRHDQLDAYALQPVAAGDEPQVIWDSPDFDSVSAGNYADAVYKVCALADVVVLVVSVEKYADDSVWELMSLLQPLQQPTVVCLNKVEPAAEPTVRRSLAYQWQRFRGAEPLHLVTLPYRDSNTRGELTDSALHLAVRDCLRHFGSAPNAMDGALRLSRHHWDDWLAPLQLEQQAALAWRLLLDHTVEDAAALYRRDFLDHPQLYDGFQLALAELLTLLELPGLAWPMSRLRLALTWPVRQLGWLARGGKPPPLPPEQAVLRHALDHLVTQLIHSALQRSQNDSALALWWRELGQLTAAEQNQWHQCYVASVEQYRGTFQAEIERTAHSLYAKLQEHPALLNSLRATRAAADAAGLALAVKTGGIGVHDFLLTPAVLSVTSLLTESAVGAYLDRQSAELKQRQWEAVLQEVFHGACHQALATLPQRLTRTGLFQVEPAIVEQATHSLECFGAG